MLINSVRLHNFKSHADTSISFGPGINVILGENGAGKTSVLEAISFALFKEYAGNIDNLVSRGKSGMSVELVFTSHGRKYKVMRKRLKGSTESSLSLMKGEKETLLQSGDMEVDGEIARILGIDKYLFTNAVYVRQGEIARLLVARPAEKKQLIGRLLGIDVLERVWDRMRVVMETYKDSKLRLETKILDLDKVKDGLGDIESQLKEVNARINQTAKGISAATASLQRAEQHEKRLAGFEKKHAELSVSLHSAKAVAGRERARLDSLKSQHAEIEHAMKEMARISKTLAPGWKTAMNVKISASRNIISQLDKQLGALKGRLDEVRKLETGLRGSVRKCPLCGSELTEQHRLGLLRERERKVSQITRDISSLVAQQDARAKRIASLENQMDELIALERRQSELRGMARRHEGVAKSLITTSRLVQQHEAKAKTLAKQIASIASKRSDYDKAHARVNELRSELSGLREASGRQHGHRQELMNSQQRLQVDMSDIRQSELEHRRVAGFVKLLGEIRSLFDKSGLQRELRIKSGPVIQEHTRRFFSEFNFDYSDLSLDEDYGITLYGQAGESTTEMISGGEKIAAALAMRLGIARALVGSSAESMMLDEPTIFLDNQRRQDLIEVLKHLSVMPQLIVVTHDAALEEAADRISVIKKERGISRAE